MSVNKKNGILPVISGGSNLLINDSKVFPKVIHMNKVNNDIISLGNGKYYIGASVRLQRIINTINKDGYGGIEYLMSVPAMLGGAIYMNAGQGSDKKSISDYLIDVDVVNEKGEKIVLSKEECKFNYRSSIFQVKKYVIVGGTFCFCEQSIYESKAKIKKRLDTCRNYQDNSKPNFGSVFSLYNVRIMKLARSLSKSFFRKNKVCFSDKTINWLVNNGNGRFKDAMFCIKVIKRIHKLFGKNISIEVIIWE